MALRHWLQLAMTEGLGPILTGRLIESAGNAEAACVADAKFLQNIDGIGSAGAAKIQDSLRRAAAEVDDELERAAQAGARVISREEDEYPILLRSIPDPPPVLYIKGAMEARDLYALAMVGSRRCSYYGREQSERFAALLAGAGMTVISGGARGVDSAAHRGALSHPNGRTLAVLGCGIDVPYPPENKALFEQIAARGAVLSEYPISTPPLADNFPRRNRIISGLSRGVLVIEADIKSGALITARQACDDHGRPVFALPGRVDNAMSAGPHKLIRDGATLVTCLQDILDGLDPLPHDAVVPTPLASEPAETPSPEAPTVEPTLTDRQKLILSHMGRDPCGVDVLIERTELPAQAVLQELTFLSLKGVVRRMDGQTFALRSRNSGGA